MTNLSTTVSIKGIARNKVIAVICIILVLVFASLIFGVFSSDKKVNNEYAMQQLIIDQQDNTERLLQDIITKKNSSSVINDSIQDKQESLLLKIVPPLIANNTEINQNQQVIAEYNKNRLSHHYSSFAARSLLFSYKPISNNYLDSKSSNNQSPMNQEELSNIKVNESEKSRGLVGSGENKMLRYHQVSDSSDYLASDLIEAKSLYELKAGSVIPAIMVNGLNSDLPGQVVAQVRENIYDTTRRKYLLIPQGARLIGLYDNHIIYGQERILVAWNRLIYQNGSSINLKAMPGTDLAGYAGFYDEVDNKYSKIFGSSFIMGVITGAMQYSQNNINSGTQAGAANNNPTVAQTLSGSLGQQLGQTGLSIAQKNLNVQPTLIVKPNYPFNIILTADMILRPLSIQ